MSAVPSRGQRPGAARGAVHQRLPGAVVCAFALALPVGTALAEHHASVRVNAAPVDATSLYQLEQDQNKQVFGHGYQIPYSQLQPQIDQALKAALASELGKHKFPLVKDCPGYCGEVKLWVSATSSFSFTKTNQPVLEIVGAATNNRLKVTLQTAARVRINVDLRGVATDVPDTSVPLPVPPPHDEEVKHKLFIDVDLPLKASAVVKLWPKLAQESFSLVVDGKATVSDNNGVKKELAQQGAQLGVLIGFTPGGLISGGPLAWSITGFILGNEGGEILQNMANDMIAQLVGKEIDKQATELESKIKSKLDLAAQQGNDFLAALLNSPVPGTNQTLQQLKSKLGFNPDVRLQKVGTDLRAVVSARFVGSGSNKTKGALHFPKSKCVIGTSSVAGGEISMGKPAAINQDLIGKVGKPCSALGTATRGRAASARGSRGIQATNATAAQSGIQAASATTATTVAPKIGPIALTDQVYLGSIPPGSQLARWKKAPAAVLTGNLVDKGTHYECGFEAKGLAQVAAIKLDNNPALDERLGDYAISSARFLVASLGGGAPQIVLNANLEALDSPQGIVFGGHGPDLEVPICYMDVNIAESASLGEELKLAFDPEKCPVCLDKLKKPGSTQVNPAHKGAVIQKQPAQQVQPSRAVTAPAAAPRKAPAKSLKGNQLQR